MKMKLFHFHRIFKNGRGGGEGEVGSSEPPLDPSLAWMSGLILLLHV